MDFPKHKSNNSENKQDISSYRNVDENSKQEQRRNAADHPFDRTHSAMDSPQHRGRIVHLTDLQVSGVDVAQEFFEPFLDLRCRYQRKKQTVIFESEAIFECRQQPVRRIPQRK